jgi:hypothetical protein
VSQSGTLNRQAGRREVSLVVLAAAATLFFTYQRASSTPAVGQQGRQAQARRPTIIPAPAKGGRDYSLFRHESHRAGLKCADCHTITSKTAPDLIAAATRPNIVRGYPYHDSCFRCHRQQVYRGDRPAFCTVCHTGASPRLTPRDIYSQFPNPKRGDIMAREFPGYFPHGLHQSEVTCNECHLTDGREAITLPLKEIPSEATFQRIEAGTFKTVPGERGASAHTTCFKCHWQESKPTRDDCNGCHLTASDYRAGVSPVTGKKLEITPPRPFSSDAEKWFKSWPADLPKRFSLKFRHQGAGHAGEKCTTCHTDVAQMTTLNIPKADVLIASCAQCHGKDEPVPIGKGTSATILDEMTLKGDAAKNYTCVACHTTLIGRERPPCTHYSAINQPCPNTRQPGGK